MLGHISVGACGGGVCVWSEWEGIPYKEGVQLSVVQCMKL